MIKRFLEKLVDNLWVVGLAIIIIIVTILLRKYGA